MMRVVALALILVIGSLPVSADSPDPTMHASVTVHVDKVDVIDGCELRVRAHVATHATPPVYLYFSVDNAKRSESGTMGVARADSGVPWTVDLQDSMKIDRNETIELHAYMTNILEVEGENAAFNSRVRAELDFICDSTVKTGEMYYVQDPNEGDEPFS